MLNTLGASHRKALLLATALSFPPALAVPVSAQEATSSALPTVDVEGTRSDSSLANAARAPYQPPAANLGPLGNKPVLDTPQSVDFVPDTLILNQQVKTVNDTLRFLPSVEIRDQQGMEVSRPQSRGFLSSIVANTRLDGLNVIGTTAIPAENLAGIQVLNGLAGALYGPESPSGVFNYILKEPTDATFFRYIESYDSQSIFTEQIDAGGRVGPDQKLGYRLNLVHGGGTGYVDESATNRTLGSLYLDYRFDTQNVISGYYSHYATDVTGLPAEIVYNSSKNTMLPSAPDPTRMGIGQPGAGSNLVTDTVLAKVKHTFDNAWTLDIGGLYENANRGLYGITDTLANNGGDYTAVKNFTAVARFNVISNSADLNGHVDIDGYRNDISFGTNGFINGQFSNRNTIAQTIGTGNLAFPTLIQTFPAPYTGGQYRSGTLFQQSIILGDTLHFNEQWALQAVLSSSFLNAQSFAATGVQTSVTSAKGDLSPTVSLIYKPLADLTLYATYANSVEEGDPAPAAAANANVFLSPYHDTMYEVGAKYAFNPSFIITLDGFRMTRPLAEQNAITNIFAVAGTQTNWGAELFAQGAITPELSLLGGITYIDARLVGTGAISTNDMLVIGVPHWKGDILADYHPEMWHGFALTGAFNFESSRAGNNTNTTFAQPFATLDLGARYTTDVMGHRVTARFHVVNVTNRFYYVSLADGASIVGANGGDTAYLGAPRTYQASLEVNF
jgi:iron complex outermembrane receptor protein